MLGVIESLFFGFEEIFKYSLIKKALGIGAVVTVLWSIIGFFIWDKLLNFGGYFIDLLPFSMLRANGAWVVSSFFWFVMVLITFALVVTFFGNAILERVSKEKYSSYTLLIAFVSAIFWTLVWFFFGDTLHSAFSRLFNWLPFETVERSVEYLLAIYFIYSAIIVTLLFVVSFLSEKIIKDVQQRVFPYDGLLQEDELEVGKHRLKDFILYAIISLVAFPFLFIPVLNFIIQIVLWVWLYKDTLVHDSAALVFNKEKEERLQEYKVGFFVISGVSALFNFLPVFNVFAPFYGELAMYYYMKEIEKEITA
jgi:hypothetical protein